MRIRRKGGNYDGFEVSVDVDKRYILEICSRSIADSFVETPTEMVRTMPEDEGLGPIRSIPPLHVVPRVWWKVLGNSPPRSHCIFCAESRLRPIQFSESILRTERVGTLRSTQKIVDDVEEWEDDDILHISDHSICVGFYEIVCEIF